MYKNNIIKQLLLKRHSSLHSKKKKKHEGTVFLTRPWNLGDSGRAKREFTRRRKCQYSQISRGQRVAEFAGWLSEVWRQIRKQTLDLFYFLYSSFSHFQWHPRLNTFHPRARQSTKTKYLSRVFFLNFCLQIVLQCSLIYRTSYSYSSYKPCRMQSIPHSCFQASTEHSCISTVSVLPATVYVVPGVCRARQ